MMDPDDFRACLISMGYDLVSRNSLLLYMMDRDLQLVDTVLMLDLCL